MGEEAAEKREAILQAHSQPTAQPLCVTNLPLSKGCATAGFGADAEVAAVVLEAG